MKAEFAKQVRDRALAQLADSSNGFNAHLAAVAADYGIDAFTLDFSGASKNFFETQLDPDDIEASTPLRYPMACLYTVQEDNALRQAGITFSGTVAMGLDIFISWRKAGIPQNTELLASAVTAAVIRTFCNPDGQANFTGPVTFVRALKARRSPVETGGEHWRQPLRFSLVFQLDTN
jgi:hypothetical protein